MPTLDDQIRWVEEAAGPFVENAAVDLQDTGVMIIAWMEQLYRAQTSSEFFVVSDRVLGDGPDQALPALVEFLQTAAEWCERHGQPKLAADFRDTHDRMETVTYHLNNLAGQALDVAYDALEDTITTGQQTTVGKPAHTMPPTPPAPPSGKGPTR